MTETDGNSGSAHEHQMSPLQLKILWGVIVIPVFILIFIGSLYFSWLWILLLPASFLIIVSYQAIADHLYEASRKCPNCGHLNDLRAIKCSQCGIILITECPECGAEMQEENTVCPSCGYDFRNGTFPSA